MIMGDSRYLFHTLTLSLEQRVDKYFFFFNIIVTTDQDIIELSKKECTLLHQSKHDLSKFQMAHILSGKSLFKGTSHFVKKTFGIILLKIWTYFVFIFLFMTCIFFIAA